MIQLLVETLEKKANVKRSKGEGIARIVGGRFLTHPGTILTASSVRSR
jgi:hypothetical protein